MSGLDRMKVRASYAGYDLQDNKNVGGKYRSFLGALKDSYQAEWITLNKGKENEQRWRCLINPSRLTENFDKKVISIDFESKVKEGTVFWWDRTEKHWMISLEQHTEEAYFRGLITRADCEFDIEGETYWGIRKGPEETSIDWKGKHQIYFNNLNYSLVIQVAKDSRTVNYFTRHKVVKIKLTYPDAETGELIEELHNWKVVATDKYSSDFLIDVYLDEWNDNEMEDNRNEIEEQKPDQMKPHIEGPQTVKVFDTDLSYSVVGLTNGKFVVNSSKVKIKETNETSCVIDILASKASSFILSYEVEGEKKAELSVTIKSF